MITKKELNESGYTALPKGGWLRIDANMMPRDWHDVCKDFGVNPNCDEIILAIAGIKEIFDDHKIEQPRSTKKEMIDMENLFHLKLKNIDKNMDDKIREQREQTNKIMKQLETSQETIKPI